MPGFADHDEFGSGPLPGEMPCLGCHNTEHVPVEPGPGEWRSRLGVGRRRSGPKANATPWDWQSACHLRADYLRAASNSRLRLNSDIDNPDARDRN